MSKEKTQPTASQVDTLMSDWLGNLRMKAEGNYTHKGKGGIRTQKSYTDYVVGDVDGLSDVEALKKARIAARNVIVSVTNEPTDVVVGGNGSFNMTNGITHTIHLATDFFDDSSMTNREKTDILLGLAAHEAAHSVYSEFDQSEKNLKGLPEETAKLKQNIWNILEDERIEYLLGDENPGLSDCIGATKEHYFKKTVARMKAGGKMPTEPVPKLINALTQAIRYPSEMERDQVVENFDELDAIRRVLTPYPLTAEGCWKATDRIMDIIKDVVKKDLQQQKQQQQEQQQKQQGEGQQAGGGQPQDGNQDSSSQSSGSPDPNGDPSGKDGKKKNSQDKKDGNGKEKLPEPTKKEIERALEQALQTSQGKAVQNALKQDVEKNVDNNSRTLCNSDNERYVNEDDAECVSAGSGDPKMFIFKPKGDPGQYNMYRSRIRASVPAMSHALACKAQETDYVLRGMPGGKLNTNKLVSFRTGCKTIFTKSGTITCSSASVCLLIDESGSMGGQKQIKAREAAILVNEAIARIQNVRFFCYGYTSDRLNVYSEMGKTSKWSLSATEARSGTPTGLAMKMAAQRVRKYGPEPCLLLVMTDGQADNSSLVISQDEKLRKEGFIPIGIGILSSCVQNTFRESVTLTDISSLPLQLGRMTRKHLDRMLVRSDE